MIRLLENRRKAGVDVKIIGGVSWCETKLDVRPMPGVRLHARVMIRDGRKAFVGSQSLREVELDGRREVGGIVAEQAVVDRLAKTFKKDWSTEPSEHTADTMVVSPAAVARKVAKAVAKGLPPVARVMENVLKEVVGEEAKVELNAEEMEDAVKAACKEIVTDAVE